MRADDHYKSGPDRKDGRMKPVKNTYHCDNYVQALTVRDNLQFVTGHDYTIEKNPMTGWKVSPKQ